LENTHTHTHTYVGNYKKLDEIGLEEIGTWATHEISKLEKCTHRGLNYCEPLKKMKLELHMKYQTFCELWKPRNVKTLEKLELALPWQFHEP
jgi:hypothetical protein